MKSQKQQGMESNHCLNLISNGGVETSGALKERYGNIWNAGTAIGNNRVRIRAHRICTNAKLTKSPKEKGMLEESLKEE